MAFKQLMNTKIERRQTMCQAKRENIKKNKFTKSKNYCHWIKCNVYSCFNKNKSENWKILVRKSFRSLVALSSVKSFILGSEIFDNYFDFKAIGINNNPIELQVYQVNMASSIFVASSMQYVVLHRCNGTEFF